MKTDEKGYEGMGWMCCGPWMRSGHRRCPAIIGVMLIAIGLIWLGFRTGWLDYNWIHAIPIFPLVMIAVGAWIVYGHFRTRAVNHPEDHVRPGR